MNTSEPNAAEAAPCAACTCAAAFLNGFKNFCMNPLRTVGMMLFSKRLQSTGPSLTFSRLCTSRHVDDLQLIATAALSGIGVSIAYGCIVWRNWDKAHDQMVFAAGLAASAATALGWAYQAGSRRLGAVDLFASEISAICKVCLVVDFAETSVKGARYEHEAAAKPDASTERFGKFTSAEHYTPVYDNSIGDLQALDFDVVTEVTRFYTYRKTMMDYLRRISCTSDMEERHSYMVQMIYMQYLMYESARLAIVKLIEFEPSQSDCVVGILCSELVLYGFLREKYDDKFQGDQLKLREGKYETTIDELREAMRKKEADGNWTAANTMAPELWERYDAMTMRLAAVDAMRGTTPHSGTGAADEVKRPKRRPKSVDVPIRFDGAGDQPPGHADVHLARLRGKRNAMPPHPGHEKRAAATRQDSVGVRPAGT